jgi:glycosyltransferase involved in cell wall biosynthesis
MSESAEGISLLIVVRNREGTVGPWLGRWSESLRKLCRQSQLIVIDDGSKDGTAGAIEKAGHSPLRNETAKGFGACVREALKIADQPIFGYVGHEYPYEPSDLPKLLGEFGKFNSDYHLAVDVVSGCRTGVAVPPAWKAIGWLQRQFYRFILGNPQPPLPSWYGVAEHWLNAKTRTLYGNPFHDVNCAFKLFRTSRLKAIPIQCDDDGVHIELIAKLTFLTTLMAEVPLSPQPDPIPSTIRQDLKSVFRSPQFKFGEVPPTPAVVCPVANMS